MQPSKLWSVDGRSKLSSHGGCAGGLGPPAGVGVPPFQLAPPHREADSVDRLGRAPSPSGSRAPLPPAPVHDKRKHHTPSCDRSCGHITSGALHIGARWIPKVSETADANSNSQFRV